MTFVKPCDLETSRAEQGVVLHIMPFCCFVLMTSSWKSVIFATRLPAGSRGITVVPLGCYCPHSLLWWKLSHRPNPVIAVGVAAVLACAAKLPLPFIRQQQTYHNIAQP